MQLSDFFSQLNLYSVSIFFVVFFFLDAVGFKIATKISVPSYLRPTYWIWGLGILVFFWFFLHFFLPFWPQYIWITLVLLGVLAFPYYFRNRGLFTLIKSLLGFPYPLVFLVLAAKPLYFLFSAPPYYGDEMIYQFYSPIRLMTETSWSFLSGVSAPNMYEMIPKFLNISFWTMFSLTKTYATARFLHFLLVFSAIYAVAIFLKEKVNFFVGILYSFLALFLSATFLHFSTLGYVDAGAAAFAILFLVSVTDLLVSKKKNNLYACAVILGVTIGMKYTILAFLFSVILIATIFAWKLLVRKPGKRYYAKIISTFCLLSVFGGYWYIKNLAISGNPIYPFFFKCLHSWKCATGFGFFSGWAIPFDLSHFSLIKDIIFQSSNAYFIFVIFSLFLSIVLSRVLKMKIISILSSLIVLSVTVEIALSKNISGFELRYYYHWVLLISLVLVLPVGFYRQLKIRKKYIKFVVLLIYAITFLSTVGPMALKNIKRLYEGDFVYGYVRNYATRRITLNEWIDYYYPQMNDFIKWCGEKGPRKNVLLIDPSLIWTSNEEYMKVFMVNCNLITDVADDYTDADNLIASIKLKYPDAYIASQQRCGKNKSYENADPDPYMVRRYEANNHVVCVSSEMLKNLYVLPK